MFCNYGIKDIFHIFADVHCSSVLSPPASAAVYGRGTRQGHSWKMTVLRSININRKKVFLYVTIAAILTATATVFIISDKNRETVAQEGDTAHADILQELKNYSSIADYHGIADYANMLLENPEFRDNKPVRLLCFTNAAQSYIKTDWPEKAREYLDSATVLIKQIPEDQRNDTLFVEGFYTYCNAMIMRYVYDNIDYREAIKYAAMALDSAKLRGDKRQSIIFGINYSILNTQIQESYAYEGAEDLYLKALETDDGRQIFQTAQLCAWRYSLLGDDMKAREYMETAIAHLPEGYMDASTVYADYAKTLFNSGMNDKAEYYYNLAIENSSPNISSSTLSVYLLYAEFLSSTGNPVKAEEIFRKGLQLADSANTRWNRKSFYYGLYDLLKKEKRYPEAIAIMDSYIQEADSIADERQRKDLIELRIKYETAVKERIIEENEKKIAQQNERLSIIAAIVAVCAAVCILLTILYFHKRKSYRTLFRLYSETLSEKPRQVPENTALPSMAKSSEKNGTIFENMEKAMRQSHIYRESGLTVEKAAAFINTNRTYLASAIKQNTGLSFIYYVNSYRIKEAMELLSDPENDTPMKAIIMDVGFKSPTTFYKLFSEATGKTPQTWRNEAKSAGNTIQNPQL